MNERLKKFISKSFSEIATNLANNPEQLKEKLNLSLEKLNKISVSKAIGKYVDDLRVLIRLIRAWISGDYKDVSYQTIIWVIIGVIYFLNPADMIPDLIVGLGFLDDLAVLKWIFKNFKKDIDKFKEWETQNESKEE